MESKLEQLNLNPAGIDAGIDAVLCNLQQVAHLSQTIRIKYDIANQPVTDWLGALSDEDQFLMLDLISASSVDRLLTMVQYMYKAYAGFVQLVMIYVYADIYGTITFDSDTLALVYITAIFKVPALRVPFERGEHLWLTDVVYQYLESVGSRGDDRYVARILDCGVIFMTQARFRVGTNDLRNDASHITVIIPLSHDIMINDVTRINVKTIGLHKTLENFEVCPADTPVATPAEAPLEQPCYIIYMKVGVQAYDESNTILSHYHAALRYYNDRNNQLFPLFPAQFNT